MNKRHLFRMLFLALAAATVFLWESGAGWAATLMPNPGGVPDYFTTPNWANSPPLRKFVDTLPGLGAANANNLGQYIPVANPDTTTYPGSDYYEIGVKEYSEQLHSDLPATRLRGYYQINNGTVGLTDHANHYLGPLIIATKGRPVRVKFVNQLLPGSKLFVPVDTTVMGSGPYEINFDPETMAPASTATGMFSENRATLHLHGGRTPWISDGTPHQWTAPAGDASGYSKGVSVSYVPDMWFDAAGNTIAVCAGQTACAEPGATTNPGPGAETFYWTNNQSARLMFYHDHAWGITRLNVYVGEAAGFLLTDDTEKALAPLLPAAQIPLIIQDKTFVDETTIVNTDPTWNWGTQPGSAVKGDLWWPHVYMPAQNPYNPNMSGINDFGRWHYGPWFYPATPVCGSSPDAVTPYCIMYGPVANPLYDPACDPAVTGFCQPPEMPGTPNPSTGAEAFMDTMVVNGTAYPTVTLEPKEYRFRILNAAHDRFLNLQLYRADAAQTNPACVTCAANTEVRMAAANPRPDCSATVITNCVCTPTAAPAGCFPPTWPTDGREGGVPDPAFRGPAMIQIGTEGGFLPKPVLLNNQPIAYNLDPTMFNVGNVLQQADGGGMLILGPAERADVIVDFSRFAGRTLILYNDAPTAFPANVPQYDYYTGAPDRTNIGGAPAIPVGLGPNVRTVMQIVVSGTPVGPTPDAYNPATLSVLSSAFTSTAGVFATGQEPVIVGQSAYNSTYGRTFPYTWPNWGVSRISDNALSFMKPDGTLVSNYPMLPKAIHDEMGASFDDYGRMSAKLGLEVPFVNAAIATFVLQNYVDPPTEVVDPDQVSIWKITHNGVDSHPIHFHLFEVQLINRVGWDGFIRLPDPNELGWKDTLKISPLEDTIVALRAVKPSVPFPLPDSVRPLNPQRPVGTGDMMGFSQIDTLTGNNLATPQTNEMYNFGWEYVWHCHILSHEENDMMRSVVFHVAPEAPAALSATGVNPTSLTWTDNSAGETGFRLQRDTDPAFPAPVELIAGPSSPNTSFGGAIPASDVDTIAGPNYFYRVQAFSPNGISAWSNVATPSALSFANLSATSVSFGGQAVGSTSPAQQVTLFNSGSVAMLVSSVSLSGANPGDFGRTTACGTVLPGGSCTISVTFSPSALGARSASLSISSDAFNSPVAVALSGTGTAPGIPVLQVNPGAHAFGAQAVGTASAVRKVIVSNTGTAPLFITSIGKSGLDRSQFSVTSSCPLGGAGLATAATCTVSVSFKPTTAGAKSAAIAVNVAAPATSKTIALTGTGTGGPAPIATVSPALLGYAPQETGTTSTVQFATVSNTGTAPLIITSIKTAGTDSSQFFQSTTCPIGGTGLATAATCTVKVRFRPTTVGAKTASLAINVSAPAVSQTVALTGTGIAPVAPVSTVTPTALSYTPQAVNTTSAGQRVTVSNTGTAPLFITDITKGGANPSQFAVSTLCPIGGTGLAPGASCTILVKFKPTTAGAKSASFAVNVTAPALSKTVTLSGTGL